MSSKNRPRFLLLTVAILLSAGLILWSALRVRYPVQGKPISEATITELSLTHSVQRAPNGRLTIRAATGEGKRGAGAAEPCPT